MAKQHDKQFKLDAVRYYLDHKELGVRGCAQNLGVGWVSVKYEYEKTSHASVKAWLVFQNQIFIYVERQ